MALEHGRQVVDLEGPLPWLGYLTEVFYFSWLWHLFVRSILFSRGTHPTEVPLIFVQGLCLVHRGSGDQGALGCSRALCLSQCNRSESQEFCHEVSASSGLSLALHPA